MANCARNTEPTLRTREASNDRVFDISYRARVLLCTKTESVFD
jgi:hypothetical protein